MDKLYRLLREYNGKDLDDTFIEDAFSIMMEREPNLGSYVKSFTMGPIGYDGVAGYSRETGNIIVDNGLLEGRDDPFIKIFTLMVLRQEIERARNLQTSIEGTDKIEPIILRCANKDFLLSQKYIVPLPFEENDLDTLRSRKLINYDSDPDKRISEIRAWRYMVNTLKNCRGSDELFYARTMLRKAYTSGYKNNGFYLDPPTYEFLVNMGFNRELKLIRKRVDTKGYSFNTRIELGLPVTYKEAKFGVKKKTKTSGLIIN
ncbi:MAG: hypothetical protein IKQ35_00340 [Bacilli bacterium]|nr:hypothetical protein [Bacilli bacterium]